LPEAVPDVKLVVFDASNLVLGRLASITAKHLLSGGSVTVVNAEKAVVTGARLSILKAAHSRLEIRNLGSKTKSPKHPRMPDGIVRLTVRGMLPRDKTKGKDAYSRLKVFVGVPKYVDASAALRPKGAENKSMIRLITVGEIAQSIGWKPSEA
jgi:large subunit ribosomal protein L13